MVNIATKKVSASNIDEFVSIIKETLAECRDTQIFVSNLLFKRLLEENKSSVIWREEVLDSFHYNDKVEKASIFYIKNEKNSKTFQMHFVSNCLEYMHLSYFATKGVIYRHYVEGMKTILIITTD